jgi:hypothetical protein
MKIHALIADVALTAGGLAFAQTPAPAPATPKLDKRAANQEQRVDKGVASGQLNAKEASRLEARESRLAANEAAAKADGHVTRAERVKLQREANRNSAAIHRQKHDKQTAGK